MSGHGPRTAEHERQARTRRPAVGSQDDVRVEDGDERVEVAVASGGEERVDDFALAGAIGVGSRGLPLHPAASAAGELPRRGRGPLDHRGDLLERHRKHVVQHEREPLGRRQRLEHHQQRQSDRVGQQRFLLGVAPGFVADDRVGDVHVEGLLAPRLAGAQHVQAHPCHHRGQPPGKVLDAAGVGATDAQPGVLNGVIGLAERAEHPVGHRPQTGPVLLETFRQPLAVVHRVTFLPHGVSYRLTRETSRV